MLDVETLRARPASPPPGAQPLTEWARHGYLAGYRFGELAAADDLDGDGDTEILLTSAWRTGNAHGPAWWSILEYDAAGGSYGVSWMSKAYVPQEIKWLWVDPERAGPARSVFVVAGLRDSGGDVLEVYDGRSQRLTQSMAFGFRTTHHAVGDVDGDGERELVVARADEPGTIAVYDLGTFALEGTHPVQDDVGGPIRYRALAVGDVDEDGRAEILFSYSFAAEYVVLGWEDGAATVEAVIEKESGYGPFVLVQADADAAPEMLVQRGVVTDFSYLALDVASGDVLWETTTYAGVYALADVDADEEPELVVGAHGGTHVVDLFTGEAEVWPWLPGGYGVYGDFDGDGRLENYNPADFEARLIDAVTGDLEWEARYGAPYVNAIEVADLGGDGTDDIVFSGFGGGAHLAPLRSGAIPWRLPNVGGSPVRLADLAGDGAPELVAVHPFGATVYALTPDAVEEAWRIPVYDYPGSPPMSRPTLLTVADTDGDGEPEVLFGGGNLVGPGADEWPLVQADAASGAVEWTRELGQGASPTVFPYTAQTGDVDGDGDDELVVVRTRWYFSLGVLVFYNEARLEVVDPATGAAKHAPLPRGYYGLALADRDGDGAAEVYLGGFDGTIAVLDGATWDVLASYAVAGSPLAALHFLDADGDGDEELAFSSVLGVGVFDFADEAVTHYAAAEGFGAGAFHSLSTADLNDDGTDELLVGAYNGVFVYGTTPPVGTSPAPSRRGGPHLSLYPNPARSHLTLEATLEREAPALRLEVYDVLGRRVTSYPLGPHSAGTLRTRVPVGDLPPGAYVLQLAGAGDVRDRVFTVLR